MNLSSSLSTRVKIGVTAHFAIIQAMLTHFLFLLHLSSFCAWVCGNIAKLPHHIMTIIITCCFVSDIIINYYTHIQQTRWCSSYCGGNPDQNAQIDKGSAAESLCAHITHIIIYILYQRTLIFFQNNICKSRDKIEDERRIHVCARYCVAQTTKPKLKWL